MTTEGIEEILKSQNTPKQNTQKRRKIKEIIKKNRIFTDKRECKKSLQQLYSKIDFP